MAVELELDFHADPTAKTAEQRVIIHGPYETVDGQVYLTGACRTPAEFQKEVTALLDQLVKLLGKGLVNFKNAGVSD